MNSSRGLKDRVVRGLAKVGLVWALAALGFLFTSTAAAGASPAPTAEATSFSFVNLGEAPRTEGLVLALGLLGGGMLILVVGSLRRVDATRDALVDDVDAPHDLSLSLGLGLVA